MSLFPRRFVMCFGPGRSTVAARPPTRSVPGTKQAPLGCIGEALGGDFTYWPESDPFPSEEPEDDVQRRIIECFEHL